MSAETKQRPAAALGYWRTSCYDGVPFLVLQEGVTLSPEEKKRMEALRPHRKKMPVESSAHRTCAPLVSFSYEYAVGIVEHLISLIKNPLTEAMLVIGMDRTPRTVFFNCTGINLVPERELMTEKDLADEEEKRARCLSDLEKSRDLDGGLNLFSNCTYYVIGENFEEYLNSDSGTCLVTRLQWE